MKMEVVMLMKKRIMMVRKELSAMPRKVGVGLDVSEALLHRNASGEQPCLDRFGGRYLDSDESPRLMKELGKRDKID